MSDVHREIDRLQNWERPTGEPLAQSLALEELRDNVGRAVVGAEVVDGENIRVVQLARRPRFCFEPTQAIRICCEIREQNLDCYIARQACVATPVNLAHAAGADRRQDLIRAETTP